MTEPLKVGDPVEYQQGTGRSRGTVAMLCQATGEVRIRTATGRVIRKRIAAVKKVQLHNA